MMTKPRLLVLTHWFVPGFRAGGPIRSTANLVAALDQHFDISVVTSDRDLGMDAPYDAVPRDTWIPYGRFARVMYVSPRQQSVAGIERIVRDARPESIYLNSLFSPRFSIPALLLRWRGRLAGRVVVAPRGELLPGALRRRWLKKKFFLSLLRGSGVVPSLHFHATDDNERDEIASRLSVSQGLITTIPNFPVASVVDVRPIGKAVNEIRLLFLSRVTAHKNPLLVLECLRDMPPTLDVALTIAGPQEDSTYWERCRQAIGSLPGNVQVTVLGPVSHERVRELMEAHHAFILPTRSENYGHSIVEALGSGRPVIVSDQTPWRALEAEGAGWDLPLADAQAFLTAIQTMARLDQAAYDRMCHAALAYGRRLGATDELCDRYIELLASR